MKSKVISATAVVKTLVKKIVQGAGKKAAPKRAKKRVSKVAKSAQPAESEFLNVEADDIAHSPGHRKMNLKEAAKPSAKSAFKGATKSKSARAPLANRRIITGAAVGKTGRVVER
ncbi:MAG: hypothetical protein H7326_09110 [Bdellovibrionaceae bacterium]|nr:hypothetical protein [Pseudobdellovibrionaceae bacterium]